MPANGWHATSGQFRYCGAILWYVAWGQWRNWFISRIILVFPLGCQDLTMSKIILGGFNLVDVGFTVGWNSMWRMVQCVFTHVHTSSACYVFLVMCTCTPSLSISPIHSGTRQWTCVNLFEPHRPDAVHTVVCTRSGGESVLFAVSISLAKTDIFVLLLVGFNSVVRTQIFLVNIHFKAFGAICGWQTA